MKFSSFISKSYIKIIELARFTGSCRKKEAWVIKRLIRCNTQGCILEKDGLQSSLW